MWMDMHASVTLSDGLSVPVGLRPQRVNKKMIRLRRRIDRLDTNQETWDTAMSGLEVQQNEPATMNRPSPNSSKTTGPCLSKMTLVQQLYTFPSSQMTTCQASIPKPQTSSARGTSSTRLNRSIKW